MNWQLIIGSGGLLGVGAIIFYLGRIVARFEAKFDSGEKNLQMMEARMDDRFRGMDKRIVSEFQAIEKRFDSVEKRIDSRCDKIDTRLDKITNDIQDVKSRLDRLEVRVEERTLKVVAFQREPQEKVLEHV